MAAAKILIVEDHDDSRTIYSKYLRFRGFEVLEARDAESAIALARESSPDLILMDASLPNIDGWLATRILKSDASTAGIPVVALTAHPFSEAGERARDAGCDGYLTKPISPRAVAAEVIRMLDLGIPE